MKIYAASVLASQHLSALEKTGVRKILLSYFFLRKEHPDTIPTSIEAGVLKRISTKNRKKRKNTKIKEMPYV